ncbi:MAG: reverse transcriptase domain-containing protein, partial [Verrucomicrobiota bacterium]
MSDRASGVVPLSETNYSTWAIQVKGALLKDGVWDIVTGETAAPTAAIELAKFRLDRNKALGIILLAIEPSLLGLLPDATDPKAVWDSLSSTFQKKSWSNRLWTRRALQKLQLGESGSVSAHITEMVALFQKLAVLGDKLSEEDKVVYLLGSLPPSFENFIEVCEARVGELSLESLKELLLHKEQKLLQSTSGGESTAAYKAHRPKKGQSSDAKRGGVSCGFCGRQNHCMKQCFEWRAVQGTGSSPNSSNFDAPNHQQKKGKKSKAKTAKAAEHGDAATDSSNLDATTTPICLHASTKNEPQDTRWCADSGASEHMTFQKELFSQLYHLDTPKKVTLGDGREVEGVGKGRVNLQRFHQGRWQDAVLNDVLYVPKLHSNLYSISSAAKCGRDVIFGNRGCTVQESATREVVCTGDLSGGLYYLNIKGHPPDNSKRVDRHVRPSVQISRCSRSGNDQFSSTRPTSDPRSQTELVGQSRMIQPKSAPRSRINLMPDKLHNDSRQAYVSSQAKGQGLAYLWHKRFGHLGGRNLHLLSKQQMVRGMVNVQSSDLPFCADCQHGKMHRLPFPKSSKKSAKLLELVHSDVAGPIDPSSNGFRYFVTFTDDKSRHTVLYFMCTKDEVFERFKDYRTWAESRTGEKIKTLRSDNGGEYTSNQFERYLRQKGIQHQLTVPKTPQQNGVAERLNRTLVETARCLLSGANLPLKFWVPAVDTATYLKNRSPTTAVDKKTPFETFLGFKPSVRHLRVFGCQCFAHVPKDERKKMGKKSVECILLGYSNKTKGYIVYDKASKRQFFSRDVVFNEGSVANPSGVTSDDTQHQQALGEAGAEAPDAAPDADTTAMTDDENEPLPLPALRRSTRQTAGRPPQRLTYNHYACFNANSEGPPEPQTMAQALASQEADKWRQAAQQEFDSLMEHRTWHLVHRPPGRKTVACRWVFKIKRNSDGSIERYKARLVAKGFTQKYGVDYDETFSPVVRFESVRALVAVAAQRGLKLHQMDVSTAFLNGDLEEEIFMEQPAGFVVKGKEKLVCKLDKSLYGLKQAPRAWNVVLNAQLLDLGFVQSSSDPCIYTRQKQKELQLLAVYVDDLVLAVKTDAEMTHLKEQLHQKFKMKDLGQLHYFLGVKVVQDYKSNSVWLGQEKYVNDVLAKFDMYDSKSISTPMSVREGLMTDGAPVPSSAAVSHPVDPHLYKSAVGSLLYIAVATRPDIATAVNTVAKHNSDPKLVHWAAVKRIMRYLKGTAHLGLLYRGTSPKLQSASTQVYSDYSQLHQTLHGFSDADWAGDVGDRKSTSGSVFILAGAAVSWSSKKQTTVATSTTEAEYTALAATARETVWLRHLLADL